MESYPRRTLLNAQRVRPNLRATEHSFEGVGGWNQGGVELAAPLPEPLRTRTSARERRPRTSWAARA